MNADPVPQLARQLPHLYLVRLSYLLWCFIGVLRSQPPPVPPVVDVGQGAYQAKIKIVCPHGAYPVGLATVLDNAGLNNSNFWWTQESLLAAGVLVARPKFSAATVEARVRDIAQHYPVNDKVKRLGVAVIEGSSLRGSVMLGDDADIARFWVRMFLGETHIRGFDIASRALCWTASAPGTVYVPYIDLDERGHPDDFSLIYTERVAPTLRVINAALRPAVGDMPLKYVVFYNTRAAGPEQPGLWKYSFHVHWFELGVEVVAQWKFFLASLDGLPRKAKWVRDDEYNWHPEEQPNASLLDLGVYGGPRQLFRGPFCGKQGNADATLWPLNLVEDALTGNFSHTPKKLLGLDMERFVMDARIARWREGLRMVEFGSAVRPAASLTFSDEVLPAAAPLEGKEDSGHLRALLDFVEPILFNQVLPLWQKHRARELLGLSAVRGAVVPEQDIEYVKPREHRTRVGTRYVSVKGDTYCEMDPAHIHTRSPGVIGISIDLTRCEICQTCFACGTVGKIYRFLHVDNQVRIVPLSNCEFTSTTFWEPMKRESPHQFVIDYFPSFFIFQRLARTMWVYDQTTLVWRTGDGGNAIIGELVVEINRRHTEYLNAYKSITVAREIAYIQQHEQDPAKQQAEITKRLEKARKFFKNNTPFIKLTPEMRQHFIKNIECYRIHREVKEMNAFPHIIPMKNRKCVNVFTLEVRDIQMNDLCTSTVSAELIPPGEETEAVEQWFRDISAGDEELCLYLKRFGAYCFTFLEHDRKMMILWAPGGKNGKGTYKEFLMTIGKGPDGFEPRCKNLAPAYWGRKGNSMANPEGCSPETLELLNKTIYYTDDMIADEYAMDKLKRIVGAQDGSGRGLYGKPIDIRAHGKVVWSMNPYVPFPGDDNAAWERLSIAHMKAKYLPEPLPIDPSKYRFRQNYAAYEALMENKDGFFSVAVRALAAYYQTLPWNEERKQPTVLGPFPVPKSVEAAVADHRARRLPLAAFMKEHTRRGIESVTIDELFQNYMTYLENMNEGRLRKESTQASFVSLLSTALEIQTRGKFVEGVSLLFPVTPAARKRGREENMDEWRYLP